MKSVKLMKQILANRSTRVIPFVTLAVLVTGSAFGQDGYSFSNQTATRMPVPPNDPATSTSDNEEKDIAWGD